MQHVVYNCNAILQEGYRFITDCRCLILVLKGLSMFLPNNFDLQIYPSGLLVLIYRSNLPVVFMARNSNQTVFVVDFCLTIKSTDKSDWNFYLFIKSTCKTDR